MLTDMSSLAHHQHPYIVNKVRMVKDSMDFAEVPHILVLKLLNNNQRIMFKNYRLYRQTTQQKQKKKKFAYVEEFGNI